MPGPTPRLRLLNLAALLPALTLTAGCGGGAPAPPAAPAPGRASEEQWRALATPRPEPLAGAARVSVGKVELLAPASWGVAAAVELPLGVSELVAAGLLRRRDVHYVERRRFAAAVEAERRGSPRPSGAPPAGVSPGAELVLTATWASLGLDSAYLDVRLADAETGATVATRRSATPAEADPAALARSVVATLLAALRDVGRLPGWTDPVPDAAPSAPHPSGVPAPALDAFFRGLAAEERWDWEGARAGYQRALAAAGAGFVEAAAALSRTARLRNGGTLGVG